MMRGKFLVCIVSSVILASLVFRFEDNFVNPTNGVKVPVGYWRLTDLPNLVSDEKKAFLEQGIQIRIEAQSIGIDYSSNGVYQVFLSGVSSFSTLRVLDSSEDIFFAHQGDLYSQWDELFVGGASALIFGMDPETQELLQYPCIIYSPDFSSDDRELMFYLRIPDQDESFVELFRQADLKMKVADLKLFESYNLASGGLIVEAFSPIGVVFGD